MSEPLRMVCSLVIVIVGRGMRPFLAARQEVADRGFLLDVAPAARVQLLHLRELLGGEALEAPDEVNELPGLAVVLRTRLAPGIPESRIPFSMMANSSPSDKDCVSPSVMSGALG